MSRVVWQGFTSPVGNKPYAQRLVAYLNEVADDGFEFEFSEIDPPDIHVHRLTELRCSLQAVAAAIAREQSGADAIVLGHFQDAGLWELRSAASIPVIGLGESSMLYACQLGFRFGLITIHPAFLEWHDEQVRRYCLEARCAGVRAMETEVDLYMSAFEGNQAAAAAIRNQFDQCGRELAAAGAEVLIPAGGLPALLLGTQHNVAVEGSVVLNAIAVVAKQAELAIKMRRIGGTAICRTGTFRSPTAEAIYEFLTAARGVA